MKAITIHQPWASALIFGVKRYETRTRQTTHRGLVAIHAGRQFDADVLETVGSSVFVDHIELPLSRRYSEISPEDFPQGAVIGVADLVGCHLIDDAMIQAQPAQERALGLWEPGGYAYEFASVRALTKPIGCSGKQGLWNWEPPDEYTDELR